MPNRKWQGKESYLFLKFSHVYFCLDALPLLGQFPLLANFPRFGEYSSATDEVQNRHISAYCTKTDNNNCI